MRSSAEDERGNMLYGIWFKSCRCGLRYFSEKVGKIVKTGLSGAGSLDVIGQVKEVFPVKKITFYLRLNKFLFNLALYHSPKMSSERVLESEQKIHPNTFVF